MIYTFNIHNKKYDIKNIPSELLSKYKQLNNSKVFKNMSSNLLNKFKPFDEHKKIESLDLSFELKNEESLRDLLIKIMIYNGYNRYNDYNFIWTLDCYDFNDLLGNICLPELEKHQKVLKAWRTL